MLCGAQLQHLQKHLSKKVNGKTYYNIFLDTGLVNKVYVAHSNKLNTGKVNEYYKKFGYNPKSGDVMTIQYPLPSAQSVTVKIYTLFGELVKTISAGAGSEGCLCGLAGAGGESLVYAEYREPRLVLADGTWNHP